MAKKDAAEAAPPAAGTIDRHGLAKLFLCDVSTITALAKSGIAVRTAHGRYVIAPTIQNYVRHLRERAAGRESEDSKVSAVTEAALFKRSQTRLNEMKIAQLESRLVDLPTIEEAWGQLAVANRQLFLALPGRAKFDLPHLTTDDISALKSLVDDMLAEAAFGGAPKIPAGPEVDV